MSAIVPFSGGQLPAYLKGADRPKSTINKDVAVGAQFPTLSIKGKVFTLVSNNERKVLTKPDDPDEILQNINLAVLRANTKGRIFYAKGYVEGDSDGARPTCQSNDGVTPSAHAQEPQAKKCAVCPKAVWGKMIGNDGTEREGTECAPVTRLAVADPDKLDVQILLRVPTASRKNFSEAVKIADTRGIDYNMLVMKVGFDPQASSPKLTFKPVGLLDDGAYAKAKALYDNDLVKEIVGLAEAAEAPAQLAAPVQADELDAAIAAKAVVAKAAAAPPPAPAPAPAPVEAPAPAPVTAKAKPAAATPAGLENLLSDLDGLLSNKDD
jgi:hypothetical protein